jgi:Tol biopolymer transport system component
MMFNLTKRYNLHISRLALLITAWMLISTPARVRATEDETKWPQADLATPSRDGSKLAFVVTEPSKNSTIWIAERDGSNPHILIDWPDSVQTEPDWAPDGQSLVFASNRGGKGYNIWTIRLDGKQAQALTQSFGGNREPRFSPDGSKIVFTSKRTGKNLLWQMTADGSDQKPVLQSNFVREPAWSPNGEAIVYSSCTFPPSGGSISEIYCHLFTVSPEGNAIKQVTQGNFYDFKSDWGHSGVVFGSFGRGSTDGLWLVNPDGTGLRMLTQGSASNPKWDQSSNTVVFTRGNDIWSVDLQGHETQLTHILTINHSPIANAGPDRTLECTGPGPTEVKFDGSGSSDPDNDPLTYTWIGPLGPASGPTPTLALPLGTETVVLTVTDDKGGDAADEAVITVSDTQPPVISSAVATPAVLSPPNHKMLPVRVNIAAFDVCSETTDCKIASVTSNEPVNEEGDSKTVSDWQITGKLEVLLRAERSGKGNGRIYTLTLECADIAGNKSTTKVNAVVQHDMAQLKKQ